MFDDVVVVYKFIGDLMFFVTGSCNENELILYTVLQAFHETLSLLLRYVALILAAGHVLLTLFSHLSMHSGIVEKKTVLENLDLALLTIDEIVDGGYVLLTQLVCVCTSAHVGWCWKLIQQSWRAV